MNFTWGFRGFDIPNVDFDMFRCCDEKPQTLPHHLLEKKTWVGWIYSNCWMPLVAQITVYNE